LPIASKSIIYITSTLTLTRISKTKSVTTYTNYTDLGNVLQHNLCTQKLT